MRPTLFWQSAVPPATRKLLSGQLSVFSEYYLVSPFAFLLSENHEPFALTKSLIHFFAILLIVPIKGC